MALNSGLGIPSRFSAFGCDLRPLLCWQRSGPSDSALAPQCHGSRVFLGGRFGSRGFPDGLQKHLAGKLNRIAWAGFRAVWHGWSHYPNVRGRVKSAKIQTDPLPRLGLPTTPGRFSSNSSRAGARKASPYSALTLAQDDGVQMTPPRGTVSSGILPILLV